MKKILGILLLISLINSKVFSQENNKLFYQKDSALPMNVVQVKSIKALDLSKQQKKQIKKFTKSDKAKENAIKNNAALTEQQKKDQLAQLKNEKLEAILTPEQKEKIKQMKKDQPRRGVTNMPNERTAK